MTEQHLAEALAHYDTPHSEADHPMICFELARAVRLFLDTPVEDSEGDLNPIKAKAWDEGFTAATKLKSTWAIAWDDVENPYSTEHWENVLDTPAVEPLD